MHYVGYDEKYDEWKLKSEGEHTDYSPFVELVSCIKRRLKTVRTDDPAVRIQIGCFQIIIDNNNDILVIVWEVLLLLITQITTTTGTV